MRENEDGGQTVDLDVAVGDAISRAAGGLKQRIAPEDAGRASKPGRRILGAIASVLFVLGFAVSTALADAERNAAFASAAEQAREEARFVAATLDGTGLGKPLKGSTYERKAAKIWSFVSSERTIVGVTVWSDEARIVFSLDGSLVGTTRPEMQSLIDARISQPSSSPRIVDDTVQTFVPMTNAKGRPAALVQIDQPLPVVEGRIGGMWNTLRLACGAGLAVSLLLLGLSFVSRGPAPARRARRKRAAEPERVEWQDIDVPVETRDEQPAEGHAAQPTGAHDPQPVDAPEPVESREAVEARDEQPDETPTEPAAPWWEEQLQALGSDLARAMEQQAAAEGDLEPATVDRQVAAEGDVTPAVDPSTAADGDVDSRELMRQRREAFKARAEQARLRGKNPPTLQEAASGTDPAE